ncbi:MFS transporter [Rhodococcus rhodnii]|uniref:Permease n=2 Tax=Rhodococcus rhodnii TaxID=38312 RepID=R7WJV3_9NOCA|nr:MFS transporter [Rhodococcus rhodnii]EOM74269.1 permease [Rhodococcus rhodnii LMG 5362]TXG89581.1 MFS transporter [Rhodococcus rhodnii]
MTAAEQPASSVSTWAPMASMAFAALWIAQLVSNLGTWMQTVGAQWMLVGEPNASTLVSLVQTATLLPVMLLALPAGVLADLVNRRRMLIAAQSAMAIFAAILAVLTWTGHTTPPVLLSLLFLLGCGQAITGPAWQAIQPELVPREQIPAAAGLNSMNINVARAIGPAIAGFLVSLSGPTLVFALNAVSFVVIVVVLVLWREPVTTSSLPAEKPFQALDAGWRFIRAAPAIRRVLLRSVLFVVPASALWALLPVVARHDLGLGSSGYGFMLGALGLGAVLGALVLSRLRRRFSENELLAASAMIFAAGTLVLATVHVFAIVLVVLLFAGIAWLVALSTLNSAMQLMLPAWVRARGLSVYLLVFMGGQAIGALAWGVVAGRLGDSAALSIATVLLAAAAVSVWWLPLREQERPMDVEVATLWPEPNLVFEPDPDDGPVMVLSSYRVREGAEREFLDAMAYLGRSRQRTGAMEWQVYRDSTEENRFLETFVVRSWAEHMRQHRDRLTGVDRSNEQLVETFLTSPSTTKHLIAAKAPAAKRH